MRFDGERLKALRVSRKWDQHRLAEAARAFPSGVTQAQVSRYENGQQPSGRNALALAAALDVPVESLYVKDGDEALRERREAAGADDEDDAHMFGVAMQRMFQRAVDEAVERALTNRKEVAA